MRQILLAALILIGLNALGQSDTTKIKRDTVSYFKELKEFYRYLVVNYKQYENIDYNSKDNISLLQKECDKILEIIHSKAKNVENIVLVPLLRDPTEDFYYYYIPLDFGGKNFPKVYDEIDDLNTYAKRLLRTKNIKKFKKLNLKLKITVDQILNNKK